MERLDRSRHHPAGRLSLVHLIVVIVVLAFAGSYFYVALPRVFYPYDLDFIEDGMIMEALRVADNLPLFVPPNADFVPEIYTPLYTYLGGLLLKVTGPSFLPLRLFSLGATLATAVLIYLIPRREGSGRLVALAGVALFLAGYRIGGGWYELVRVDPLFVALTLGGLAMAATHHDTNWGLVGAGLLMALSIWTKQNGFLPGLVAGAYLTVVAGRRVWRYVVVLGLGIVLPAILLEFVSDGWFSRYVLTLAYTTPLEWSRFLRVTFRELPGSMAILIACYLLFLYTLEWDSGWRIFLRRPWPVFISSGLIVTIASRTNVGGNLNTLILGYALLCLTPGLLAAELAHRQPSLGPWIDWAALVALLPQFFLTIYNPIPNMPTQYRPTEAMRAAGDELVAQIAAVDGETLVMMHPFYVVLAGKEPSVQIHALWLARARATEPLPADLVSRLEQQQYALIISDLSGFEQEPALKALLDQYYQPAPWPETASPPTLSGVIVRPVVGYTPRG